MTDLPVPAANEPSDNQRTTLLIAYICYGVAALGIPIGPIAGVIINHLKIDETRDSYIGSHHRWLLRTFWFSLAWSAVCGLLMVTILLIPLAWVGFIAVGVWYLYRVIRGALSFADRRPMPMG